MKTTALAVLALLGTFARPGAVEPPLVLDLWPGKPPGDVGIPDEEKFFELMSNGKVHLVAGKPTKCQALARMSAPSAVEESPSQGLAHESSPRE